MQEQLGILLRYAEGMWHLRWRALLIAWVVALVGWGVVYLMPNTYQARIVINVNTYSVIDPLLTGIATNLNAGDTLVAVTRMMLSRENLEAVLLELGIGPETHSQAEQDRWLAHLRLNVTIEDTGVNRVEPNSRIYSIQYVDESRERAYRVVDKLSKILIESSLSSERRDMALAEDFLDVQIADHESRLTIAEQRLADFKRKNVGLMPDERGGYFARLQNAMSAIENTRTEIQLATRRYDELERQLRGESPLINSAAFGGAGSLVSRLQKAEDELAGLLNRFTPEHPNVQEVERRIEELRSAIDAGISTDVPEDVDNSRQAQLNPVYQGLRVELSKAGVELESLKIRLGQQEKQAEELRRGLNTMPDIEAQLSRLNRDYEVTRSRYLDLVNRRESTQLAQHAGLATSDSMFRVIEPVRMPMFPSGPQRGLLLTGVLAAAIGAGMGLVLLLVLLRPTFMSPKDLREMTELPVLGSVGLYLKPEAIKRQLLDATLFMAGTILLLGGYMAVLIYNETASMALRTLAGLE